MGLFVNWPFNTSRGLEVTVSDKMQAKKEPFRSTYGMLKLMKRAQTDDKTNKLTNQRELRFLCQRSLSGITSFAEYSATSPLCTNTFINLFFSLPWCFHVSFPLIWVFLEYFFAKIHKLTPWKWGLGWYWVSDVSMHKTYFESFRSRR